MDPIAAGQPAVAARRPTVPAVFFLAALMIAAIAAGT